jgi:hypothetical protein
LIIHSNKQNILLLAAFDSQLRYASCFEDFFSRLGWNVTYIILQRRKNQLSDEQIRRCNVGSPIQSMTLKDLFREKSLSQFDAILLCGNGSLVCQFLYQFTELIEAQLPMAKRPIIITGWEGLVYELGTTGFLLRQGADIICTNNESDSVQFSRLCEELGLPSDNILTSGQVILRDIPYKPFRVRPVKNVLFAAQTSVPPSREERMYILRRLCDYANHFNDRKVIIKPRHKLGESSFHRQKWSYEFLLKELAREQAIPKNLCIDYSSIPELLQQADLCLTVSSTAALESLMQGIPTGILFDIGLKEDYGNLYFRTSGCLTTFDELLEDRLPIANDAWMHRELPIGWDPLDRIYNRLQTLLRQQEALQAALPLQPFFYVKYNKPFLAYQYAITPRRERSPIADIKKYFNFIVKK